MVENTIDCIWRFFSPPVAVQCLAVCELNKTPVTFPETQRESGETQESFEPSLFFDREGEARRVKKRRGNDKENLKWSMSRLHGMLRHFAVEHAGSKRILHSSGVPNDSWIISQLEDEQRK